VNESKTKPLSDINAEAIRLLSREFGVANPARFIRQFGMGSGNYTEERKELFGNASLEDLLDQVRARRIRDSD